MSDNFIAETKKLTTKLTTDAKEQLKTIDTVKQMTKLARELGEDTTVVDSLLEIAGKALKDIVGKIEVGK